MNKLPYPYNWNDRDMIFYRRSIKHCKKAQRQTEASCRYSGATRRDNWKTPVFFPHDHDRLFLLLAAQVLRGRKLIIFPEDDMIKNHRVMDNHGSQYLRTTHWRGGSGLGSRSYFERSHNGKSMAGEKHNAHQPNLPDARAYRAWVTFLIKGWIVTFYLNPAIQQL